MCLPRELGGLNCPVLLYLVTGELLARADVSVMAHHSFHGGMAMAMLVFSMHEGTTEIDRATGKVLRTRFQGAIEEITRNNARLGVGFESIGLCEAALRAARAYAEGRECMGKPIARHEIVADYLEEMESDIAGLRALAMHGAFHEEMSQKLAIAERFGRPALGLSGPELARARASHARKARRATPLLKYLAAEKTVEMARRCLQIHGGNGYMKDYPAEKLLRDACVMPIYEGTSQIQSLMAMKDTLAGAMKRPKEFLARLAQARWRSLSARDPLERRLARIQVLSLDAAQFLLTRTAATKLRALSGKPVSAWTRDLTRSWDPKRDFALAMLHAERLTRLLADEAVGEILFAQARCHEERRLACERYLERAEPRARFLHDEITTSGERLLRGLAGPEVREAAEA